MTNIKASTARNVSKTIKMSQGHAERLERVCTRLDVSVNAYMLQALARALIADEGRIAQADFAQTMTNQIGSMFDPFLNDLLSQQGSKEDD